MRKFLTAVAIVTLAACASGFQAVGPAPHLVTGEEYRAIDTAIKAENIGPDELTSYAFAVVRMPDRTWEIGIDRLVEDQPGRKMNGSPTGEGVVYVISPEGNVIRRYFSS